MTSRDRWHYVYYTGSGLISSLGSDGGTADLDGFDLSVLYCGK